MIHWVTALSFAFSCFTLGFVLALAVTTRRRDDE